MPEHFALLRLPERPFRALPSVRRPDAPPAMVALTLSATLAIFGSGLGGQVGGAHRRKQRLQLHRKSDVPSDTHAAGCDHRDAIEPAIQDTQAVLARHREGHIRLGVDTFLNPAS
ncbi:MAG: hypothetical protein VST64_03295, partial [Nitrospirota bacterium]|nr:hypothetical protein [Nitrospirota bacterium]